MANKPVKPTARAAAARALARAAEAWPDLDATPLDLAGLDGRDARQALAIQRTALQRWITLAYLLDGRLNKPLRSLEPMLQGVLLSAGAQITFMDRMPVHAVVDESVELAKALVRPGAAGLVNAVLRKIAALPEAPVRGRAWTPGHDRLPLDDGYVQLSGPCLPEVEPLDRHLGIAGSCPPRLINSWIERWGRDAATRLAAQSVATPPTIVAVEAGFAAAEDPRYARHEAEGFLMWRGTFEELSGFLAKHPGRRVQDPAAAKAAGATAGLSPRLILDYCAGRGTKTAQLAAMHPGAEVVASDTDPRKLADLRRAMRRAVWKDRAVTGVDMTALESHLAGRKADLVVLDVPCSNTAVLARRPEARFRVNGESLASLGRLQEEIVDKALRLATADATILYSTCSLEERENERQVKRIGGKVIREETTLPAGREATYHDGGYFALLRR